MKQTLFSRCIALCAEKTFNSQAIQHGYNAVLLIWKAHRLLETKSVIASSISWQNTFVIKYCGFSDQSYEESRC